MNTQNLNRTSIYETLKHDIAYLKMIPGSAISEAELISRLNVSRTPIREALIRLHDDGLVDIYPQRGTFVSKIDLQYIKEMNYMRHVLETDVCFQLCNQRVDLKDEMEKSFVLMELACRQNDNETYIELDNEFHRGIFRAANLESLWNVIAATRTHYIRYLMLDMMTPEAKEVSIEEHKYIIDCLACGQAQMLVDVLAKHHDCNIDASKAELIEKYPDYFLTPMKEA